MELLFLFLLQPILINNWEVTYFDFTDAKLLEIATEAKQLGLEMLILDDSSSLGDWTANEKKLGGTLKKPGRENQWNRT
jgi:Alpha-galactosidase